MKACELTEILKKKADAEVFVIAGKEKKTFVVEDTAIMSHTIFLIADKTPYEADNKYSSIKEFFELDLENDGATRDWVEFQRRLKKCRLALKGN